MADKKRAALLRKRIFNRILTRGLLGASGLMLVLNLVVPTREYSAEENRNLAKRPAFSTDTLLSGDFFSDFDTYYSDQFVGRDLWMRLRTAGVTLMGRKDLSGVYFGKDGYLIQDPAVPDGEAVEKTAAAIKAFTQKHADIPSCMMLIPDAASILGDKLPDNAPVRNQATDILAVSNEVGMELNVIDATSILRRNKEKYIYYKTDHHWTSLGAKLVFTEAALELGISSPIYDYQTHLVSDSFQGTLASKSGKHGSKDTIEIYEPMGTEVKYYVTYPSTQEKSTSVYMSEKLQEKDQYQVFFGGNYPVVEIRTTADNQRNLLVFKDSYANSFVPFLIPYYEKIIMVDPRYYYDDIEIAMTSYGITDILYLYSGDTILTDTSLADTLNAALEKSENGSAAPAAQKSSKAGDAESAAQGDETQAASTEAEETAADSQGTDSMQADG